MKQNHERTITSMTPATHIWLILLTPLAGFITTMLLSSKRNALAGWVATGFSGLNFCSSLFLFQQIATPTSLQFSWFSIGNLHLTWGFLVDTPMLMMVLLVNFIAILVQLFSIEYMATDKGRFRYFAFIQLFVFAMLGIVVTDNLLVMYAFWELVGLMSYLLIGFWYEKKSATDAAKKAFLVNRVGDIAFVLGIFLVYFYWGNFSFGDLQHRPDNLSSGMLTLTGLLLFGGCVGKSAQFPLHVWLPDAMEGPTPVSAMIHAATMVAAGIFLLSRVQPVFTIEAHAVIATIGCITMLLGSLYAIVQTDIKKTLAYSTIAQLGLMLIGLGSATSLFHLLTHAFFKAGLFLAAGSVIHALHHANDEAHFDAQDMRLMGGLRKQLPVTFYTFVIFAAALAGLPLFSGFLSKDAILANLYSIAQTFPYFKWIGICTFVGIAMTAFYMTRQVARVFFGTFRNSAVPVSHIHEGSWKMLLPLFALAILSLGIVFSGNPLSATDAWFWHFIDPSFTLVENHSLAYVSLATAGAGIGLGWFTRHQTLAYNIPTFDKLYTIVFVKPILFKAKFLQKFDKNYLDRSIEILAKTQVVLGNIIAWLDKTFVDGIPSCVAYVARLLGSITRSVQGGQVQLYIVAALMGLLGLFVWILS